MFDFLYSLLSANAPLSALVGTRIYPDVAPEGTSAPYIVYFHISATPADTHNEPTQVEMDLVQFSCFGSSSAGARAVVEALVAALDGQAVGSAGNATLLDRRSSFDEAARLFRADADFLV